MTVEAAASPTPPDPATAPAATELSGSPSEVARGRLGSVFYASVTVCAAVRRLGGVLRPTTSTRSRPAALNWLTATFGWAYLVITLAILIFLVFLAFSPFGEIRLGKDERPAGVQHVPPGSR